jgi:pimeloyl-ACP methyl ester carboxylesterase
LWIYPTLSSYTDRPLTWQDSQDPNVPWTSAAEGSNWEVRINDFPDEYMYSLLIDGQLIGDFMEWPAAWQRGKSAKKRIARKPRIKSSGLLGQYTEGRRAEVWRELGALGPKVRADDVYPHAVDVARETMKGARHNVDLLISRLTELGKVFHPAGQTDKDPRILPATFVRKSSVTGAVADRISYMDHYDEELKKFEISGAQPLPPTDSVGIIENRGARIWFSTYGSGAPVILLHGGLGHSGNWGYQVQAFMAGGYRAVVIDSRGHGRSTRDQQPYSYELMASDVLAVMNAIDLDRAVLVGWSDGACTAVVLAAKYPERVAGVFYFACNMDPTGVKAFESTPTLNRCFARHAADYKQLSATPQQFDEFVKDVSLMQRTQPNYSAEDLANITVPVRIVQSEKDEFILREHAEYLAQTMPRASFLLLPGVSHFAPLQRPAQFNKTMLAFVDEVYGRAATENISA